MKKTIGRNQKARASAIFEKAKNIKVYDLENCFTGTPAQKISYRGTNWLSEEWLTYNFSKLYEEKPNQFCLYIHSNCWYEFEN